MGIQSKIQRKMKVSGAKYKGNTKQNPVLNNTFRGRIQRKYKAKSSAKYKFEGQNTKEMQSKILHQ